MLNTLKTELSTDQISMASLFLHYTESFVLAHEIGHLAILLCPDKLVELDIGLLVSWDQLSRQSDISASKKRKYLEQWTDEIAADLFALRVLQKLGKDDLGQVNTYITYTSAQLVFLMMNMLEQFGKRKLGVSPPIGNHPPALLRLEQLRSAVAASNLPEIAKIGRGFEEQTDNILNVICPV